ncbi:MAG TPA: hypothetical protein VFL51_04140 [Pseudolabrys sp.]|nr:hypothetical protein [Pseudolabrys sp.]
MLLPTNRKALHCYDRALKARLSASESLDEQRQREYLAIERVWIRLAYSYEHAARIDSFLNVAGRKSGRHPLCPTCHILMRLVGVEQNDAAIKATRHFRCNACGYRLALSVRAGR